MHLCIKIDYVSAGFCATSWRIQVSPPFWFAQKKNFFEISVLNHAFSKKQVLRKTLHRSWVICLSLIKSFFCRKISFQFSRKKFTFTTFYGLTTFHKISSNWSEQFFLTHAPRLFWCKHVWTQKLPRSNTRLSIILGCSSHISTSYFNMWMKTGQRLNVATWRNTEIIPKTFSSCVNFSYHQPRYSMELSYNNHIPLPFIHSRKVVKS